MWHQVPLKHFCMSSILHGATPQKIVILKFLVTITTPNEATF